MLERYGGYAEGIGKVGDIVATSQAELLARRTLAIHVRQLSPIHAVEVRDVANGGIPIDQRQVIGYALAESDEIERIALRLAVAARVVLVEDKLLLIAENALASLAVDLAYGLDSFVAIGHDAIVGFMAQHDG